MKHCATSRKVVGLIPDGVIGIFIDIIPLATQWPWGQLSLLTEMSTRNISCGVKVAGVYG